MMFPTYALVLLVAIASISAFAPPKGRHWCTCRPKKCNPWEWPLDRKCRLTPIFPLKWTTCCKWLPWWATNGYGGGFGGGGFGGIGGGGFGGLGGGGFGGLGGGGFGGFGGGLGGGHGGGGYGKKY